MRSNMGSPQEFETKSCGERKNISDKCASLALLNLFLMKKCFDEARKRAETKQKNAMTKRVMTFFMFSFIIKLQARLLVKK